MTIDIKYCNNIESGTINIQANCLNIKYAINGTGKSTISKAIQFFINDKFNSTNTLLKLKPFKYRSEPNHNPEINGVDKFNTIAVFDEEYVNTYVFLPNEIMKNSFDIFIKNEKYEQGLDKINRLIDDIRKTFQEHEEIDIFINDLNKIIDCSGRSESGLSAAGSFKKALSGGNLVENVPNELEDYTEYIKSEKNVPWLGWQIKGKEYINISDKCPYCTSGIAEKKNKILGVSEKYDSKHIEHLNKVIEALKSLNDYFTDETKDNIERITKNIDGLTTDQESYLFRIKKESEDLSKKLSFIKTLNFHSLKEIDKIVDLLNEYKIDITLYTSFNTQYTINKINLINGGLDNILKQASILQGEVNKQKILIRDTIEEYKNEINIFLKYAGYNYNIDSIQEKETYRIILRHNDHADEINSAKDHLSYGERNALALVLFMFEAIKKSADLIILDDPISSFDKNKKFAIINMLFRGTKSLRGKTVIMLTHDFEPIIDIIYNLPQNFNSNPNAHFLENNNGIIIEKPIIKSDIKPLLDISNENIEILSENINKMIYLRRLFEINNEKKESYNLLSNLFHKREKPENKDNSLMTDEEIQNGTNQIKEYISDFKYDIYYAEIIDTKHMIELYKKTGNNYEKMQLYRIINPENSTNDVIRKFINESFHIENDYLFQLNPSKYQLVPQHIINECDKDIIELQTTI